MSDRREPPSSTSDAGVDPASPGTSKQATARLAEADAALALDVNDLDRREDPYAPLEIALPPEFVDRALSQTDARANGPGRGRVQVSVQKDGTVLIQGTLNASLVVPCARCLADAGVDGSTDLVATFVPADRVRGLLATAGVDDEEIELESEELEEFPYQGKIIDLRKLVDEQLGLAYPMRALCERGEACAGLCSNCGQDLNAMAPGADGACANCGAPVLAVAEAEAQAGDEPDWKAKLRLLKGD